MATISGLNTFVAGTPAQASEVNTNFGIVKSFAEGLSTGANLDAGSITVDKLGANSVNSDKIVNLSIVAGDIADDAITAAKILAGAVGTSEIALNAVITDRIATNSIITDRIALNAVTTDRIALNAVITDRIAAGAVTTDRIAAGAVTPDRLQGGATFPVNITGNAGSATTASTANNALAIANGTVTAAKLNGIFGVTETTIGINMTTSYADYKVVIPNGRSYFDVINISPLNGTNSGLWIESYALGDQGGVITPNEAIIRAKLTNASASTVGYVRFWFAN
jgi:hypothetical protein